MKTDQLTPSSIALQHSAAYFAAIKAANTLGYFSVLYLSWRVFTHHFDWQVSTGCVILSACWLVLTRIKIDHLLQTYFDILSRIEISVPILVGTIMSCVAIVAHGRPLVHYCAIAEIFGWLWIFGRYRANRVKFIKEGHGPMPRDAWVNPPANVLRPGDLILTSGNVAKELHETVGHAEMVLRMSDGSLKLFSSYMGKGAFLHDVEAVTKQLEHGHYIALHLREPWNEDQSKHATEIALQMVAANRQWAANEQAKYCHFVDALPMSEQAKSLIEQHIYVDGYDWFGTFMGRLAPNRWTCIGACLELYHRMGVQTNYYGTGLLGFGTTLFDPILPVRFLSDPAFELIKTEQKSPATSNSSYADARR